MSRMEDFGFWLSKTFVSTKAKQREWPHVPGTYFVADPNAPVAVTTLGSVPLAKDVFTAKPEGLCIVGKVETENIGIEKIIKNILSNTAIRFLVCAGNEPPKHLTGATFLALFKNGVDDKGRIIGSPGMRPLLPNTTTEEINAFCERITPIDLIGCTDIVKISREVASLAARAPATEAKPFVASDSVMVEGQVERVSAMTFDPAPIKLDEGGYFVIQFEGDGLLVEHYDYKDILVRIIEGEDARNIYLTLIDKGWVTKLDHAAYLGKELARAEMSLTHGIDYIQDGA